MKTNEQIIKEIYDAMQVNKDVRAKCNTALSDAISLVQHIEKEMQDRLVEEYNRGMNDAWETAREILTTYHDICPRIFGEPSAEYVIRAYAPNRAKSKIESYNEETRKENNKVHVGDVVKSKEDETKATVLDCDELTTLEDERYWTVFTENGCVETWCEDDFTKTGESVDVNSVLIK